MHYNKIDSKIQFWKFCSSFHFALFHILEYLDQFKTIKETLLRSIGPLEPPRAPNPPKVEPKAHVHDFSCLSNSMN